MRDVDLSGEIERLFGSFLEWLPRIIGALAIFVIGWLVALLLKSLTVGALVRFGLNKRVFDSPADSFVRRLTHDPARAIGVFIYWLVMIITITIAIGALQIPILTELIRGVYAYVPNLLGAIFILFVALALSAGVSSLVMRWMGDTPTGKIVSTIVPVIIISIAGFAILEELGIAPIIITATYIAVVGAVALGFALAFGLGSTDVAARIMENFYDRSQERMDQFREDLERGRERAHRDSREARKRVEEER